MAPKLIPNSYILGLDVGEARIGAAIASTVAKLPRPLPAIQNNETSFRNIAEMINKENASLVVVGIPRNLSGEETAQSLSIRAYADELAKSVDVPIEFADESLSSVRAEEMAKLPEFKAVSTDSLSACFILEEFFAKIGNE